MKLQYLKLNNFRNYKNFIFNPNENINIICGKNGTGKTSIVEAIYTLILTKSFRTINDRNLITFGEEYFNVIGNFSVDNDIIEFKIYSDKDGKKVFINNNKIKLLSDYISKINVVLFNPDDMKLIKDSPNIRRKYLNINISQYDKNYLFYLNDYNKILKQRNSYIKQLSLNYNNSFEYLDILTKQLIEKGLKINEFRNIYINKVNKLLTNYYNKIGTNKNLLIKYKSHFNEKNSDEIFKIYEKNQNRELDFGKTLIGVHLDDYIFSMDDKNIKDFGSEGQQKNAIISLKLSEIELLKERKNTYPICILDDIFSELDNEKINNILEILPKNMQTFITTTDITKMNDEILNNSKIFKLDENKIGDDKNE